MDGAGYGGCWLICQLALVCQAKPETGFGGDGGFALGGNHTDTEIPNGATAGREAPTVNAKSRNGLGGKGKPRPISEAKKSPQSEWGPVSKIVFNGRLST